MLHSSFRHSDTAGGYGGEEFVAILPETDISAASAKLEQLREMVANTSIELGPNKQEVGVTISAGLACFPEDADKAMQLFAIADVVLIDLQLAGPAWLLDQVFSDPDLN